LTTVVGRFAPSPTGDLHLGSLVAATASYLSAKRQQGKWLVRIDDLDTPRIVLRCDEKILRTLEAFGFEWDSLIYQSQRLDVYQQALLKLQSSNCVYTCLCSRKELKSRSALYPIYDRHCRELHLTDTSKKHSYRLKTPLDGGLSWQDKIKGKQHTNWQSDVDDFIVKRNDGIYAYHLACAVDDVDFGITEVIRGVDLLPSSAPQQLIQQLLGKTPPQYGHHDLIIDKKTGIKLSKASGAPALKTSEATAQLMLALTFLGLKPPITLKSAPVVELWHWAKNQKADSVYL
jgi:glutamyl-Q tRNA(Asp) synthetase